MGRHGGGSRSGGSSRSSSSRSSSSRGGGSGTKTSKTPFRGCYNRSYYDRRGKFHKCYTNNRTFGMKSGWNAGIIFALIFVTLHMSIMLSAVLFSMFTFGSKVNGDKERIFICDQADILTESDEKEVLELLEDVYDASGMPVTIYTDDFSWKEHYRSLAVYSEELYYGISYDEDAMIILFTVDNSSDFYDWEYDMYCGDDTIKCFSDAAFDKLLDNFQKGMAGQDLAEALQHSWTSVIDDLAKTTFKPGGLPILVFMGLIYGMFYTAILSGVKSKNDAYKYFKENPEKLSRTPMTLYSECPNCGASNAAQSEICPYCRSLLKISDGTVKFVKTEE